MWLSHDSFMKVVEDSWAIPCSGTPQYILVQKLKCLKLHLKVWNKEVFGYLKVKISGAGQKVMDLQTAFADCPCAFILLDFNSAKFDLHNWLNAESVLWKQRAKIRWLQDGDRNTTFFHLFEKPRGIRNRIDSISEAGMLFEEEVQIRDQATLFFSNLLKSFPGHINEALSKKAGLLSPQTRTSLSQSVPLPRRSKRQFSSLRKIALLVLMASLGSSILPVGRWLVQM